MDEDFGRKEGRLMKTFRYIIPALCLAAAAGVVAHSRLTSASGKLAGAIVGVDSTAQPVDKKPAASSLPASFDKRPANGTKAKCAVTGEEYTVSDKTQFATYNGKMYGFCCPDCKPDFEKNPAKYAK
jgi:YHS domain-containing protein